MRKRPDSYQKTWSSNQGADLRKVRLVEIPKDDGGVRNLGIPTVFDRFIQQAITQALITIYVPISLIWDNSIHAK